MNDDFRRTFTKADAAAFKRIETVTLTKQNI